MSRLILAVCFALACGKPAAEAPVVPPAPVVEQAAAGPAWIDEPSSGLRALVFPPVAPPVPLVIALHGLGDRPEAFHRLLDSSAAVVNLHVPAAPLAHGRGFSWFPVRASPDDAGLAVAVKAAADQVAQYIGAVRKPSQKVVVTGFSQGGMLSFALAAHHPEVVDLAVPIGGFLPVGLRVAGPVPPSPVFALHGAADERIAVGGAQDSVAWLDAQGGQATLRTWAGVGHTISAEMRQVVTTLVETADPAQVPASGAVGGAGPG